MKNMRLSALAGAIFAVALGLGCSVQVAAQSDPLPSWNDTPTKQAIVEFVGRVTKTGGADFIAPAERIATFDNDGTLWVEQAMPNANRPTMKRCDELKQPVAVTYLKRTFCFVHPRVLCHLPYTGAAQLPA